jgi:hypothetical protein
MSTALPYFYVTYIETPQAPSPDNECFRLHPLGYMYVAEGEWFEEKRLEKNVFFNKSDAMEALAKMRLALRAPLHPQPNLPSSH